MSLSYSVFIRRSFCLLVLAVFLSVAIFTYIQSLLALSAPVDASTAENMKEHKDVSP